MVRPSTTDSLRAPRSSISEQIVRGHHQRGGSCDQPRLRPSTSFSSCWAADIGEWRPGVAPETAGRRGSAAGAGCKRACSPDDPFPMPSSSYFGGACSGGDGSTSRRFGCTPVTICAAARDEPRRHSSFFHKRVNDSVWMQDALRPNSARGGSRSAHDEALSSARPCTSRGSRRSRNSGVDAASSSSSCRPPQTLGAHPPKQAFPTEDDTEPGLGARSKFQAASRSLRRSRSWPSLWPNSAQVGSTLFASQTIGCPSPSKAAPHQRQGSGAGGGGGGIRWPRIFQPWSERWAASKKGERESSCAGRGSVNDLVAETLQRLKDTKAEPIALRRSIFRDLQRQLHPDKNSHREDAATLAFQTLMQQQASYFRSEQ